MATKKRAVSAPGQLTFGFRCDRGIEYSGRVSNIADAFKRLYYHLYTNSESSRAERIVSDLSLLLLFKLAVELNSGAEILSEFIGGRANSDSAILPLLRETYPGLVDKRDRFAMGDEALRQSLKILKDIVLSAAPAHVLGDAFQALIGPRLRGDKGQFFTPRSLVRAMVRTIDPQPGESILDPACGTGGFLCEAYGHIAQGSGSPGRIVGVDKDHDLFRIASALVRVTCGGLGEVYNRNSLSPTDWQHESLEGEQFDVVLTNPPFGSKIGVKDKTVLGKYALSHQWVERPDTGKWKLTDIVAPSQDPQILFLELCVRKLKPGGRMGIVLPEGVFGNRRTAYVWEWIREQGAITALLDCPRTTFQPGTDTKTNVLFFRKNTDDSHRPKDMTHIFVALNCGHDRRGRTHLGDGTPYPDDFASVTKPTRSNDGKWRNVRIDHPHYLVPRYYIKGSVAPDEKAIVAGAEVVTLRQMKDSGLLAVRKGHEVGSHAYGTGDIPFVRTSDVNNFELSGDPTKSVSDEIYEQYAPQQKLRPGDVLMVVDGRYRIGATALLTESNHRCIVQSHFRIISLADHAPIDAYELMFALNLPSVKMRIRNLVFVQSTLGTLGNRLLELEIPLLHGEGPWQNRVASFRQLLMKRDESLAHLRRMTATEYDL